MGLAGACLHTEPGSHVACGAPVLGDTGYCPAHQPREPEPQTAKEPEPEAKEPEVEVPVIVQARAHRRS